jgi:putative nucleotidyltransferase with HDIG domain
MNIHPILKQIAAVFAAEGKDVYLVGGAVRDMLRGQQAQDWDLATNALPDEVAAMWRKRGYTVILTGIKHGTVTVMYRGQPLEVTTFRTEADYTDGRRPESVTFHGSIKEDLSRRDLTINAMALELPGGRLVDPFGGEADIKKRLIRCVGDPALRFAEDGLRPLRALRFAAQLGFAIDPPTLQAIPGAIPVTAKVSPERVRTELEKILKSKKPSQAILPMQESGLLALILPELDACKGVDQKGYHKFDVYTHSILACDYAASTNAPDIVRWAALLHDIGKPPCRRMGDDGVWTFYRHEEASAKMTDEIMRRLRSDNATREQVCHLIREHMFHYTDDWSDAAVRRFIIRVGEKNLGNLYRLRLADTYGTAGMEPPPDYLLPLMRRVDKILAHSRALSLKDLAIGGKDLIDLGIPAGKRLGVILNCLLEAVLEDPAQNTREKLLEIARNKWK